MVSSVAKRVQILSVVGKERIEVDSRRKVFPGVMITAQDDDDAVSVSSSHKRIGLMRGGDQLPSECSSRSRANCNREHQTQLLMS